MSTLLRYLKSPILADLEQKMVFLGGPRQVGKTTFARSLLKNLNEEDPRYLTWDLADDKKRILNREWPLKEKLIIFDELHKYARWRNLIKGYWDTMKSRHQFLVTGSARLDYYQKSGDSLLGRYHYYRMHPLSISEIKADSKNEVEHLLNFGGFPEPFLDGTERSLRRWHNQRLERIVSDDIRELEQVRELSLMHVLMGALPDRVGSPLSRKNLSQNLEVDFKTLERWISILENVYYCYRISPYGTSKIRAVTKEQKIYLWDWSEHSEVGKKWENFVASHLLKYCHFVEDTEGFKMNLHFLRDTDGREVDFVVTKDKKPIFAVECKTGERNVSSHLSYFLQRTPIPKYYQVHLGTKQTQIGDRIFVLPFQDFCKIEKLV